MQYIDFYSSPVGELMLACDEIGLLGVWFKGKKHYASVLKKMNRQNKRECRY